MRTSKFNIGQTVVVPARYPNILFRVKQRHFYDDGRFAQWLYLAENMHSGMFEKLDEQEMVIYIDPENRG